MDFNKFKQLREYIDKHDYYSNWIGIKNGGFLFSYLAQAAIIAFGYFYIFSIIRTVEQAWATWIVSTIALVFLGGYEIFKRSITDKWAQDVVKHGFHSSMEFIFVSIFSILLYGGSFYVSLNGAMMFADRRTEISEQVFVDINVVKDSINTKYNDQITLLDSTKNVVVERQLNDKTIEAYNTAVQRYSQRGWKTDQDLVNSLRSSYDATLQRYNNEVEDINSQILTLREQRDEDISASENRLTTRSEERTEESAVSSNRFVFLSIMFEMMIIFGIWFRRYFQHRSLSEWKDKLQNDPKIARWYKWDQLLGILYRAKFTPLETGNQIPGPKDFSVNCKIENMTITEFEVRDYFKALTNLQILETRGSRKYILQNYEGAKQTLARQFEIGEKKNPIN